MPEISSPCVTIVELPRWVEEALREHLAIVIDRQGRLVAFSVALQGLLQRDLRPELGRRNPDSTTIAPQERPKLRRLLGAIFSGQAASLGVRALTITHHLPSGELLPLLVEYHPVFDRDGDLSFQLFLHHEQRGIGDAASLSDPRIQKYASILEASLARLATLTENRGPPPAAPGSGAEPRNGELRLLTEREREELELMLRGSSARGIAEQLSLSVHTVKHHTHAIFRKLRVGSRAQLLSRFLDVDAQRDRFSADREQGPGATSRTHGQTSRTTVATR
jgi:DNA-binding CsgD family transcriptional regulator